MFSTNISATSPCLITKLSVFSRTCLMELLYSFLSACARSECTAGPLDILSILDCINVRSIFFPISPPSASISRTRCPFELPPIFGLHGIIAILSTLTVNTNVCIPNLAEASAASQPACPAPITTTSYSSYVYDIVHSILLIYCLAFLFNQLKPTIFPYKILQRSYLPNLPLLYHH